MPREVGARHFRGIEFLRGLHPVEDFARMVDGEIIEIDAVGLHLAGVERQRAVVESAGKRDRNGGHASPLAIRQRRLGAAALFVIYACPCNCGYKAISTARPAEAGTQGHKETLCKCPLDS